MTKYIVETEETSVVHYEIDTNNPDQVIQSWTMNNVSDGGTQIDQRVTAIIVKSYELHPQEVSWKPTASGMVRDTQPKPLEVVEPSWGEGELLSTPATPLAEGETPQDLANQQTPFDRPDLQNKFIDEETD